jgi:hypothetical protein
MKQDSYCNVCGICKVSTNPDGSKKCSNCLSCFDKDGNVLEGSCYPDQGLKTMHALTTSQNTSFYCVGCEAMTLEKNGDKLKCSVCGQAVELSDALIGQVAVEGYAVPSPS